MKLYKLTNGELTSINTEYKEYSEEQGKFVTKERTAEELQGYKPLVDGEYVYPNQYQNSVMSYTETDTEITRVYSVEQKPIEEITEINQSFWDVEYFQITPLGELYVARNDYFGNNENMLKLITEASNGNLFEKGFTVFTAPVMTELFTSEYMESLKQTVTDITQLTAIVEFLEEQTGSVSTPSVI